MAEEETSQVSATAGEMPAAAEAAPEAGSADQPAATATVGISEAAVTESVAETAPEVAPAEAAAASLPELESPAPPFGELETEGGGEMTFEMGPELTPEVRRILRVSVPVIVKLADKRLSLGEIIDVSPGSIIEFAKSAEQPLELLVNNQSIGRGIAVKVGEKFGLRIDQIVTREETIRSLG
jgi:flagellar motor switch protein FliN/FliY